ncbi:2-C-methyl-D-erythritol 2,4-cyclodiphosphate synthase [Nonomuraea cavernae]|uniref:2-C-methyl-D-erythritol 2,4-cyclodiphosphate synthase n=1 Tax=Nonomuraea cavernae TaxID=2045107 RepID=A0A918DI92_9ACTN|nr:2-C-methyl-D-erythritol 2,4-cyclodiphosphate synthase [Nonomuraea cavernae]MCA2187299.1 2-C-methyl-D-erythritol 2,4-cyclodiphosphate synthase [Nonomuraea cavernae]GGO68190.1 2-C-methyl-D-erythritol 2,4-cyclodiphosphate synthase [Nonomuraea cavernae]
MTTPCDDAPLACFPLPRIGTGVDIHPFAAGRPMRLAGLDWPDEPVGLAGEPDGDVVVHAACNALLTAADLGDLGAHFDTSTPEWEGAAPTVLLAETARLVSNAGFRIGNVSIQLIGEHPRLGPRRVEAQKVLTAALGAPVFLGAATPEGLGWIGRGDGLAAIANALIVEVPSVNGG